MGLCPVRQHIFALKSLLVGEFFSTLRHQQAVDLFTAQTSGNGHRIGKVPDGRNSAYIQGIAVHKGGIHLHLHLLIGKPAVAHRFIVRKILHFPDSRLDGISCVPAVLQHFGALSNSFHCHAPGCNHTPHPIYPPLFETEFMFQFRCIAAVSQCLCQCAHVLKRIV